MIIEIDTESGIAPPIGKLEPVIIPVHYELGVNSEGEMEATPTVKRLRTWTTKVFDIRLGEQGRVHAKFKTQVYLADVDSIAGLLGKYGDLRLSTSDVEGVAIKVTLLDI